MAVHSVICITLQPAKQTRHIPLLPQLLPLLRLLLLLGMAVCNTEIEGFLRAIYLEATPLADQPTIKLAIEIAFAKKDRTARLALKGPSRGLNVKCRV